MLAQFYRGEENMAFDADEVPGDQLDQVLVGETAICHSLKTPLSEIQLPQHQRALVGWFKSHDLHSALISLDKFPSLGKPCV